MNLLLKMTEAERQLVEDGLSWLHSEGLIDEDGWAEFSALTDRVKALKPDDSDRWIPVGEAVPNGIQEVLVFKAGEGLGVGYFDQGRWWGQRGLSSGLPTGDRCQKVPRPLFLRQSLVPWRSGEAFGSPWRRTP